MVQRHGYQFRCLVQTQRTRCVTVNADALNGVVDSDAIHGELYHGLVSSPNHHRIPTPVCEAWSL